MTVKDEMAEVESTDDRGAHKDRNEVTLPRWVVWCVALGVPSLLAVLLGSFLTAKHDADMERTRTRRAEARIAPRFEFDYLLLPNPRMLVDDLASISGNGGDEGLTGLKVLLPGEGVNTEAVTAEDLDALPADSCLSDECTLRVAGDEDPRSMYVYLKVVNVGQSAARNTEVRFEPIKPSNSEHQEFSPLFSGAKGDGTFAEGFGTIEPEEGFLIPLASVGIVQQSAFPMGFVAVGDVRRPTAVRFGRVRTDDRTTVKVRQPIDGIVMTPASRPYEGGG